MIWGGEGWRGGVEGRGGGEGWRGGVEGRLEVWTYVAICYSDVIWRRQGSGGVEGDVEGSREGWRQKETDK